MVPLTVVPSHDTSPSYAIQPSEKQWQLYPEDLFASHPYFTSSPSSNHTHFFQWFYFKAKWLDLNRLQISTKRTRLAQAHYGVLLLPSFSFYLHILTICMYTVTPAICSLLNRVQRNSCSVKERVFKPRTFAYKWLHAKRRAWLWNDFENRSWYDMIWILQGLRERYWLTRWQDLRLLSRLTELFLW